MDFGSWLQQMRLERHMDLRTFAELIGVNMSTISSIENSRMQVTLATAIRICERLGVTLPTLLQAMQGKPLSDLEPQDVSEREGILILSDVLAFIGYIGHDWQGGCTLLSKMLNAIAVKQMSSRTIHHEK